VRQMGGCSATLFYKFTMPIDQISIEVGWLYKTPQDQDRVVIRVTPDSKVVYACRGGLVQNPFENREESSLELFAKSCSEKVKKLSDDEFNNVIKKCNAQALMKKYSVDGRL
jgi:hypothetical protein